VRLAREENCRSSIKLVFTQSSKSTQP
jgi:hypothetical protein